MSKIRFTASPEPGNPPADHVWLYYGADRALRTKDEFGVVKEVSADITTRFEVFPTAEAFEAEFGEGQEGWCFYNSTEKELWVHNGAIWERLTDPLARLNNTTGLVTGGNVTVAGMNSVAVEPGYGYVVSYADTTAPTITLVEFEGSNDYIPFEYSGTFLICINKNGDIVEVHTSTNQVHRDYIVLAGVSVRDGNIEALDNNPRNLAYGGANSFRDFIHNVIGPSNVSGNEIVPNNGYMSINNPGGYIFVLASNYRQSPDIPDIFRVNVASIVPFYKVIRTSIGGEFFTYTPEETNLDPNVWDDASGAPAIVPPDMFTIQVVFITPGGNYVVALGQQVFATMDDALANVGDVSFEENIPLVNFVRRSFIVVKQGAYDLGDPTQARFIQDGKFRAAGGGISGSSGGGGDDYYHWELDVSTLATINLSNIEFNKIGTPAYDDLRDFFNAQGAGVLTGCEVEDSGLGQIDISAGSGIIKTTDDPLGPSMFFDIAEVSNFSLEDGEYNHIYIDYNYGVPAFASTLYEDEIDHHSQLHIATVVRINNSIVIHPKLQYIPNMASRMGEMEQARKACRIPGVAVLKPYIEKVDDNHIDIKAGAGWIRKADLSLHYMTWPEVDGLTLTTVPGQLHWACWKWNAGETALEFELKEYLPDNNIKEFEQLLICGRVWYSGTLLEIGEYHQCVSSDPYTSRSQAWLSKAHNVSVEVTYSNIGGNHFKTLPGEMYRWPITDPVSHHHTFEHLGISRVESMWGHMKDETYHDDITDIGGNDAWDIRWVADYFDNGGSTPAQVPPGKYTIHRFGMYALSEPRVWFRGQNLYGSIAEAKASIASEHFEMSQWASNMNQVSILSYVIMKQGARDFSDDSEVSFVMATGAVGGSAVGAIGWDTGHTTSGLISGGDISTGLSDTLDIAAGRGVIVDYTDPETPEIHPIEFGAVEGYVISLLNGGAGIGIDKYGAVVEVPMYDERTMREYILLGTIAMEDGELSRVNNTPMNLGYDGVNSFKDFVIKIIGPANVEGNNIEPHQDGAMKLFNEGGQIFILASNMRIDPVIPDIRDIPLGTMIWLDYVCRMGQGLPATPTGANTLQVDPTLWDDGSGTPALVPLDKFTVQQVYLTQEGQYIIALGQALYDTMEEAAKNLSDGTLDFEETVPLTLFVRRTFIILAQNATDLFDSTQAQFTQDGKFRLTGTNVSHDVSGLYHWDDDVSAVATIDLHNIKFPAQLGEGSNAFDDLAHFFNVQSAGVISGCEITDVGDGTIDLAEGVGIIKTTDDPMGDSRFFKVDAEAGFTLVDGEYNYLYIEYRNEAYVAYESTLDDSEIDHHTRVHLATIHREGSVLTINETTVQFLGDFAPRLKNLETFADHFRLPGVDVLKPYIEKVDDNHINVNAGAGWIRKADLTIHRVTWPALTNVEVTTVPGQLPWCCWKWNVGETSLVFELKENLPDNNIDEFEQLLVCGRIWYTGSVLTIGQYHQCISADTYVSRSQAWANKSYNASVGVSYSGIDNGYLATTAGELFRWPIAEPGTKHHTFKHNGIAQFDYIWGHMKNNQYHDDLLDDSGGDGYDVASIADYYDDGGSSPAIVPPNNYVIHRFGMYALSEVRVWFRGQTTYGSMDLAKAAISTDPFVMSGWAADMDQISILAYVIMKRGARDFSDQGDVAFINATASSGGGGGGGGTDSPWVVTASGIEYNAGDVEISEFFIAEASSKRVGIGTLTPQYELDVHSPDDTVVRSVGFDGAGVPIALRSTLTEAILAFEGGIGNFSIDTDLVGTSAIYIDGTTGQVNIPNLGVIDSDEIDTTFRSTTGNVRINIYANDTVGGRTLVRNGGQIHFGNMDGATGASDLSLYAYGQERVSLESTGITFNYLFEDQDFVIRKAGSGEAYKYDAGDNSHVFDGPVTITDINGIVSIDATFEATLEDALDSLPNLVEIGAVTSGSIAEGFGSINIGVNDFTTTGTVSGGTLTDGTITIQGGTLTGVTSIDDATESTFEDAIDHLENLVEVGSLDAGNITENFGSINVGASSITTIGTIAGGTLTDGTITISGGVLSGVTSFDEQTGSLFENLPNLVEVGALDAGSITSGFGAINIGDDDITTTGIVSGGTLTDGTITISSGALSGVTSIDATFEATLEDALDSLPNLVEVGVLDAGSITSGFGGIDIGDDALNAGAISGTSFTDGTITIDGGALEGVTSIDETTSETISNMMDIHDVNLPVLGDPTYSTMKDWYNITQSAGCINGGWLSGGVATGTVDVTAGTGMIKTSDNPIGDNLFFDFAQTDGILMTNGSLNYLYVDYNSGFPFIDVTLDPFSVNGHTKIMLGMAYRKGVEVHIAQTHQWIADFNFRTYQRLWQVDGFKHAEGIDLIELADRYFKVSAGIWWASLSQGIAEAKDMTGDDTFTYIYRDGDGDWVNDSGRTRINNTKYDNGSGNLRNLKNKEIGIHWVYYSISDEIWIQYGQESYKRPEAQSVTPPETSPRLENFGFLIGKILIEKGKSHFEHLDTIGQAAYFGAPPADDILKLDKFRDGMVQPGVEFNEDHIYKVDEEIVGIVGATGWIRSADKEMHYVEWEETVINVSHLATGNLTAWIVLVWDPTETFLVPEAKETLPDYDIIEFEQMLVLGKVVYDPRSSVLVTYPRMLVLSTDPFVVRSDEWRNKSYNISIEAEHSHVHMGYLKTLEGQVHRWPCAEYPTKHHTFVHPGIDMVLQAWAHSSSDTVSVQVWDNGLNDETDIQLIADYWDDEGVVSEIPAGAYGLHAVGLYAQSEEIVWYRSQALFSSMDDAEAAIGIANFELAEWASNMDQIATIAYVILEQGARDFSNPDLARFVNTPLRSLHFHAQSSGYWQPTLTGIEYVGNRVDIRADLTVSNEEGVSSTIFKSSNDVVEISMIANDTVGGRTIVRNADGTIDFGDIDAHGGALSFYTDGGLALTISETNALVTYGSAVFNSGGDDRDFTIRGIGSVEAYRYDAGATNHRWSGNQYFNVDYLDKDFYIRKFTDMGGGNALLYDASADIFTFVNKQVRVAHSLGSNTISLDQSNTEGILLANEGMRTGWRTPGLMFGSNDGSLGDSRMNWFAGIFGRGTQYYTSDADSGMALDFFTTPNTVGPNAIPQRRLEIREDGFFMVNPDRVEGGGFYVRKVGGDAIEYRHEDDTIAFDTKNIVLDASGNVVFNRESNNANFTIQEMNNSGTNVDFTAVTGDATKTFNITGHGLTTGNSIAITNSSDELKLPNGTYEVIVTTDDQFTIEGLDDGTDVGGTADWKDLVTARAYLYDASDKAHYWSGDVIFNFNRESSKFEIYSGTGDAGVEYFTDLNALTIGALVSINNSFTQGYGDVHFNHDHGDHDFTIRKDANGEDAYIYDAGNDSHTFDGTSFVFNNTQAQYSPINIAMQSEVAASGDLLSIMETEWDGIGVGKIEVVSITPYASHNNAKMVFSTARNGVYIPRLTIGEDSVTTDITIMSVGAGVCNLNMTADTISGAVLSRLATGAVEIGDLEFDNTHDVTIKSGGTAGIVVRGDSRNVGLGDGWFDPEERLHVKDGNVKFESTVLDFGANIGSTNRTNNTDKEMKITAPHYSSDTVANTSVIAARNTDLVNWLMIGADNDNDHIHPTDIRFYTATADDNLEDTSSKLCMTIAPSITMINPGKDPDHDFAVMWDSMNPAIFVNAENGHVGIGTGSPDVTLQVHGDISIGNGTGQFQHGASYVNVDTNNQLVNPDFSNGNVFLLYVSENFRLGTPSNVKVGAVYYLCFEQLASGRDVTSLSSEYFVPGGNRPDLGDSTGDWDCWTLVAVTPNKLLLAGRQTSLHD